MASNTNLWKVLSIHFATSWPAPLEPDRAPWKLEEHQLNRQMRGVEEAQLKEFQRTH